MIKEKKQALAIYSDQVEVTDRPSANEFDYTPITPIIPKIEIAKLVVWYKRTEEERRTPALQDAHPEPHRVKLAKKVESLEMGVEKIPTNYFVSPVVPIVATPKINVVSALSVYQETKLPPHQTLGPLFQFPDQHTLPRLPILPVL